tara:strand:+ start:40 stop:951 length:912 start_codon:yes stop_codon:yes gene_type:complete
VNSSEYTIHDPACGTCGFLIGAFEYIMKQTDDGSKLKIKDRERLTQKTFSGGDYIENTRRLGLMNCYLHEIVPNIYSDDSLAEGSHVSKRYNLVLTNPPFGSSGAGSESDRADFLFRTTNKQLNFVQHVMTILKVGGQCAIIVPDGVLFDSAGNGIRENLLKQCDLHTILRLPEGTFVPYAHAKANVLFFTKGRPTNEVWTYDLRTNVPNITKKKNPLSEEIFEDFEKCYSQKPRKKTERFEKRTLKQVKENKFDLEFKFIKDKNIIDINAIPEPDVLSKNISQNLKLIIKSIEELSAGLQKG